MIKLTSGEQKLLIDLHHLCTLTAQGQFGDFTSEFATPKMELVRMIDRIRYKAVNGVYDDNPPPEHG